jgi:hypothetical protein
MYEEGLSTVTGFVVLKNKKNKVSFSLLYEVLF